MRNGLRQFWEGWKRVAHKIGTFQARVLLTVLYFVLVLPFGVSVRFFADPLRVKRPPTKWLERSPEEFGLDWARRQ